MLANGSFYVLYAPFNEPCQEVEALCTDQWVEVGDEGSNGMMEEAMNVKGMRETLGVY